jgi:hypothetical protein
MKPVTQSRLYDEGGPPGNRRRRMDLPVFRVH